MPYLRVVSVRKVGQALVRLRKAYLATISSGTYQYYHVSVILMYLFSVLEDIVAIHQMDFIVKTKKDRSDGVLVSYPVFLEYAMRVGIADTDILQDTLFVIVGIRNTLAHSFIDSNLPFNRILTEFNAIECMRIFKNAINSINLSKEAKIAGYELLYDLFRRDGLRIDNNFETLYTWELNLLKG